MSATGDPTALREQIRRLERELDDVHRELAALSYAVSHDFLSPVRVIDGFSEALAEDYRDRLDGDGIDYLRRVRSAAARLQELANDLAKLARVSRGELRRGTVDLSEIARSIAEELRGADPSRQVEFSIAPEILVEGDPVLLRTAFEHLLANSWKFTSRHPSARIEVGFAERDGKRVILVRDDGAGFDPIYAGKLFGPFQRLHSANEFQGNGIGLAVVRRIVHRHGGRVWATGDVEKGATIWIELG